LQWINVSAALRFTECARTGPSAERGAPMNPHDNTTDDATAPVPWMQQLLDNPFLLLFLGVMVPMVVYTVWGVFDILTLPVAK
jgi:hypothetical protein